MTPNQEIALKVAGTIGFIGLSVVSGALPTSLLTVALGGIMVNAASHCAINAGNNVIEALSDQHIEADQANHDLQRGFRMATDAAIREIGRAYTKKAMQETAREQINWFVEDLIKAVKEKLPPFDEAIKEEFITNYLDNHENAQKTLLKQLAEDLETADRIDENFRVYFNEHIADLIQLYFAEVLKKDNAVWVAYQKLFYKNLEHSLTINHNELSTYQQLINKNIEKNGAISQEKLDEVIALLKQDTTKSIESLDIVITSIQTRLRMVITDLRELKDIALENNKILKENNRILTQSSKIQKEDSKTLKGIDEKLDTALEEVNKPPKHLGTTATKPELFLGRDQDLKDVHHKLFQEENLLLLVNGQGGIGKTTLAAQYYHTYTDEYQHLAWLFAEKSIMEALLTLAIPLKVSFPDNAPNELRLQLLLQALQNLAKPCLLIIDNANNIEDLEQHYQALRSCPNFHILLTTRITEFEQANFHAIEPLKEADAVALFRKHYPKYQDSEKAQLISILEAIGYNTLVIELLAKNLHQFNRIKTKYSLDDLLKDLQEKGLLALSQTKAVKTDYQQLVKAKPEDIISAMYDLGELTEEEKALLAVFAVLPAESIPFETLEDLLSNATYLEDPLLSLSQKGWLDYNPKGTTFKVSPVIQEVTLNKHPNTLADCHALIQNLREKLASDGVHLTGSSYEDAATYAKYAAAILHQVHQADFQLSWLCTNIGKYHQITGNIQNALSYCKKSISIKQSLCKQDPENTIRKGNLGVAYQNIGDIYSSFGDIQQALHYYELWLESYKKLYGQDPTNSDFKNGLAIAYEKLGETYTTKGDLDKALEYYEKDVQLSKELHQAFPDNVNFKNGLAIAYQFLGNTYSTKGNIEEALKNYNGYSQLSKELYDTFPDNVKFKNDLAIAYEKLGTTYTAKGELDKALTNYNERYRLTHELHQAFPNNVNFKNGLAIAYERLGTTYTTKGDLNTALINFKERAKLGEELNQAFPDNVNFKNGLAIAYCMLGITYTTNGNIEEALKNYNGYSQLSKELYDTFPDNVKFKNDLAIAYEKLGTTYTAKGDLDKALTNFNERARLGKELHQAFPDNVNFKNGLAVAYYKLGQLNQKMDNIATAKDYFEKAQDIWLVLATQFPSYAEFKWNLGIVEEVLGEL